MQTDVPSQKGSIRCSIQIYELYGFHFQTDTTSDLTQKQFLRTAEIRVLSSLLGLSIPIKQHEQ